jgi:hypothetical protein
MLGLSAALHALAMIGVSASALRAPSPVPENQLASTPQ